MRLVSHFVGTGLIFEMEYIPKESLMRGRGLINSRPNLMLLLWLNTPKRWSCNTNIQGRSENLPHFCPGVGLKLGSLGFSRYQNNSGSSRAYVTCIYCGLSIKINMCKMPHGTQTLWTYSLCIRFCVCGQQKSKDPPVWAPWLKTPLHGTVYEVWDLPCISLSYKLVMRDWKQLLILSEGMKIVIFKMNSFTRKSDEREVG